MVAAYDQDGVQFKYPANWRLERQDNEDGWTVTVQSPETAFFMLCCCDALPEPTGMADSALDALREEYEELEADDAVGSVAGQPAIGHDIRFFSLDLPNTCWTRSFIGPRGTLLAMCQLNDLETSKNEPVLRAICASLTLEEE